MARTEKEKEREDGEVGVELLVHISAPCRGKDDNHYRALASAYLLFEPVKSLSLDGDELNDQLPAIEGLAEHQSYGPLQDSVVGELRLRGDPKTVIITDDDDIYDVSQLQNQNLPRKNSTWSHENVPLKSPQASFCSVLDNLNSPLLRKAELAKTPSPSGKRKINQSVAENESSWETPPSVIPDSQSPHKRVLPEFSSPTKILELYRQHFDSTRIMFEVPDDAETSKRYAASTMNIRLDSSQPIPSSSPKEISPVLPTGTNVSTQAILDTPSVQHQRKSESPKSLRKMRASLPTPPNFIRPRCESTATRSGRPLMPSPSSKIQSTEASQLPVRAMSPSRKRRKIEVCATPAKQHERIVPPSKHSSKPIRQLQPRITPHEIHPPPPCTSIWGRRPPQIITPALYHLAIQLELPRRFRPASQTRPLRDLERGYWAVATASWPQTTREQAWAALGAYVGQGKAGWGVWGVRCFTACAGGEEEERGGKQTGWRVYCWGGVAGHVYLLLYLVSQRKVKGTGAKWIDGGGEVALRMS